MRLVAVLALILAQNASAGPLHAVAELFTSQGCSSCPPADAVAGRLVADPAVLVLSFHVDYWDDLGWKDEFSSAASTSRQYGYAKALHETSVFTPQLIVNGSQSLIGSQEREIRTALAAAHSAAFPIDAQLTAQADGHFRLTLSGPKVSADVWEVRYVRRSSTSVRGGENAGHTFETFNDVTHLRRVGAYSGGTLQLEPLSGPDDGIAVLVQASETGRILGAAAN